MIFHHSHARGASLCMVLAIASPARADELAEISKAGVLTVGIFEDSPLFASTGTDLKPQGCDIDVINALAKALGVKAELVGITGHNRTAFLTEHKVTPLVSVGKSTEREKVIAFCEAYAPYFIAAWRAKALAVANAADLKGKTVCVNRGTLEDTSVTDAAPSGTDIQRFNDLTASSRHF